MRQRIRKGSCIPDTCQLGILGKSFPFSHFSPFYEVGTVITLDDLWIEDSVNKRCIVFGTCNTLIECVLCVKY